MLEQLSHGYGDITAPTRHPLNRDRLSMLKRGEAVRVAHAALSGVQEELPELMVMGIATLFAAVCERAQLDAGEMHRMAQRVLRYDPLMRRDNDSVQSLRDFVGIRVLGERNVSIS